MLKPNARVFGALILLIAVPFAFRLTVEALSSPQCIQSMVPSADRSTVVGMTDWSTVSTGFTVGRCGVSSRPVPAGGGCGR